MGRDPGVARSWRSAASRRDQHHPDDAGEPARDHGELGPGERRDDPGLDVAEAWPAGDDGVVDRREPAAELVGSKGLQEGAPEHRRDHVCRAGDREEDERQDEDVGEPEEHDGEAPHRDRDDIARPCRRMVLTQPVSTEATSAPAPGAA